MEIESREGIWAGHASAQYVAAARRIFAGGSLNHRKIVAADHQDLQYLLTSDDAELLIEVADSFAIGFPVVKSASIALALYERAFSIDRMKGAYALGRFYCASNRNEAQKYLKVAASCDHVASHILLIVSAENLSEGKPAKKRVTRRLFPLMKTFYRVYRATRATDLDVMRKQWWRYKDDLQPLPHIDKVLSRDRNVYLPWAKPINIRLFTGVIRQSLAEVPPKAEKPFA